MTCYFRDRGDEKLPPYLHTTPKNVNEAFLASSCRKNIACKEGISSFLPPFPALHRTQTTHSCSFPNSSTQSIRKRLQSSVSPSLTRMPPPSLLLLLFLSLSPLRYLMLLLPALPPPSLLFSPHHRQELRTHRSPDRL